MSEWPTWVLPVAIGVGVVLLGMVVFLIVRIARKDKVSGDSVASAAKPDVIGSELSAPQISDEAKSPSSIATEPEFRTPTVPASQAVGFGWAKASDLAQLSSLEGDEN